MAFQASDRSDSDSGAEPDVQEAEDSDSDLEGLPAYVSGSDSPAEGEGADAELKGGDPHEAALAGTLHPPLADQCCVTGLSPYY